jgi:large subunit ribosomal protein L6
VSRVGKQPIPIPSGVQVEVKDGEAQVKGTKGLLRVKVHPMTQVREEAGSLIVSVEDPDDRDSRAFWGLTRALLANAVTGVVAGFEKRLILVGVGYRADIKGKNLELQVGYSHSVTVAPEPGIELAVDPPEGGIEGAQATIVVRGADKELVGRTAAEIRKVRRPEPYKGKGIRYSDEHVKRKAGKAAVSA